MINARREQSSIYAYEGGLDCFGKLRNSRCGKEEREIQEMGRESGEREREEYFKVLDMVNDFGEVT